MNIAWRTETGLVPGVLALVGVAGVEKLKSDCMQYRPFSNFFHLCICITVDIDVKYNNVNLNFIIRSVLQ